MLKGRHNKIHDDVNTLIAHKELKRSRSLLKWSFLAIGILTLIIVISLSILSTNSDKLSNKCNTIQVPYKESIEKQIPLKYTQGTKSEGNTYHGINYYKTISLTVTNIDDEAGEFNVKFIFNRPKKAAIVKELSQFITPGQTQTFNTEADTDFGESIVIDYFITPGSKTITEEVTNYKTETICS